jgi:putative NADPH-quinone reductase
MPALFKGFLEHTFRPGFAMEYKEKARIVVTIELPVTLYWWYFGAFGVRGFERSILSFAGIKPIRESLHGLTFTNDKKRARWIEDLRRHGRQGD